MSRLPGYFRCELQRKRAVDLKKYLPLKCGGIAVDEVRAPAVFPYPEPRAGQSGASRKEKQVLSWFLRSGSQAHKPTLALCQTLSLSLAFPEIYPVKQMFSISLKNRVEKICTSENGTHVELGLAYSENSKFTSAPHAPAVGQRLDGHVARSSAALFNRVSRISTRGLLESRKSSSIRRAGELYRLAALFHRGVVPRPFHRVRFDFFPSPPTSSGTPRHSPSAPKSARRPRRPPTKQRILPPNT